MGLNIAVNLLFSEFSLCLSISQSAANSSYRSSPSQPWNLSPLHFLAQPLSRWLFLQNDSRHSRSSYSVELSTLLLLALQRRYDQFIASFDEQIDCLVPDFRLNIEPNQLRGNRFVFRSQQIAGSTNTCTSASCNFLLSVLRVGQTRIEARFARGSLMSPVSGES